MADSLADILRIYDPAAPLDRALTIPAPYYTDARIAELENRAVFGGSWQVAARLDQLREPGSFVTTVIASEPIVVVRGQDAQLRAFFNVCRHHAAAVATTPEGNCDALRCPYHGWTYDLAGTLKTTPDFAGACDFDKSANGLVPVRCETWENFVFVNHSTGGDSLADSLDEIVPRVAKLNIASLRFFERRSYILNCNWKVYVDNYLDGGYHIP